MTSKIKIRKPKKLSDEQFFAILRENAGIFSRAARKIREQYGISYTRQAVRDRALKSPELLQDIFEESMDVAEEGLQTMMRSNNERIKLNAIIFFLKMKGQDRGYTDKLELNVNNETEKINLSAIPTTESQLEKYNALMKELANGG